MVSRPSSQVDLASASLLIALDEFPDLDIRKYLQTIDLLARSIRPHLQFPPEEQPVMAIEVINRQLFEVEGFRGNHEHYYDPRNSYLNEVLDRKLGIPITLSVIYMEVGMRLGLKLEGVGMPGHFIVKTFHRGVDIFVDPFSKGEILLEQGCCEKLAQVHGEDFQFDRSYLNSVSRHQILTRMLTNLKLIYFQNRDYRRALGVTEKILLVTPELPAEIRDRGSIHYKLNHLSDALKDWVRYLELQPAAPDASEIKKNITAVSHLLAFRN
jgi:regulator of sirC expression with transglutaminase-like and TPR domain